MFITKNIQVSVVGSNLIGQYGVKKQLYVVHILYNYDSLYHLDVLFSKSPTYNSFAINITHNSIHDDINKLTNTLLRKNKNVQCVCNKYEILK